MSDGIVMLRNIVQLANAPDSNVGIALESVSDTNCTQFLNAFVLIVKSGVVAAENVTVLSDTQPMKEQASIICKSAPNETRESRMLL